MARSAWLTYQLMRQGFNDAVQDQARETLRAEMAQEGFPPDAFNELVQLSGRVESKRAVETIHARYARRGPLIVDLTNATNLTSCFAIGR